MIELKILQNKNNFIKVNGDKVIDLIRRSVSFLNVKVGQGRFYVVEDGLQMRGDLIAKASYQTTAPTCLLLKYNGISNPFSIDANDLIRIPDDGVLSSILSAPEDINGSTDNWITSTRKKKASGKTPTKSKQDQNRINYLAKDKAVAPPNVAKDSSVKISNGKLIFGSDVTSVKKEDCPDPISRTKLQAALLKNKLFS